MNRAAFYTALRARNSGVFGTSLSQAQVNGVEGILDAFITHGDGRRSTLAYALATAYHETGRRMVPVREGFATTDAGARRAVAKLAEKRGANSPPAKYGASTPPYGHAYYGRGHVQLTWIDNYRESSADAGTDLVANPDAMLDPVISARVLIKGLIDGRWNGRGKGVGYYADQDGLPGLSDVEAIAARRTVNVQDRAAEIAGYYRAFDAALAAGGHPVQAPPVIATLPPRPPQAPASAEAPSQPLPEPEPNGGPLAWFLRILARIFGGKA